MGEMAFPAWDPVFLDFPGPFDLRYYGLMYVVGFVCGHLLLTRLARARFLPVSPEAIGDLIFYLVLGVVVGGRLGYSLFYKPEIFTDPFQVLRIWEGGLSFHGGLLGVVVALLLFARKHEVPGWRLADCLALAVCPGILAVRIANFINGELYGRIIPESDAAHVPWAMRFPTDPAGHAVLRLGGLDNREKELAIQRAMEDGTWERVKDQVPLRHPSQIYEALAEGLLLGVCLWAVYRLTRKRPVGAGVYAGLFLLGYGLLRFGIEYFRQPDEHFQKTADSLGTVLWGLSMGQVLCLAMIVVGVVIVVWRRGKQLPPGQEGLRSPVAAQT